MVAARAMEGEEVQLLTFGEHLQHWLTDEKGRDQFLIRSDIAIELYWNLWRKLKPELIDFRVGFTQHFVKWSPLGTYLGTIHGPGPSVWGTAESFFHPLMLYYHSKVQGIDFSPGENFLVSYSSGQSYFELKIGEVKTGEIRLHIDKRTKNEPAGGGTEANPTPGVFCPVFRWCGKNDDKYFAIMEKDEIWVYDTLNFTLIQNEPLRVKNIKDFSWSPADSVLALYIEADDSQNQPALVSLVQIPSRKELRKTILPGVIGNCKMYWQSNGDWLVVLLSCFTEGRTREYHRFLFLCVKEPDLPIVELELEDKNERIIAFAWEPERRRFVFIHGLPGQKSNISIYSTLIADKRCKISKVKTLDGMQVNSLYWSPVGRYIIFAELGDFGENLIFYDASALQTLANWQFKSKAIEWSPTGRYVATSGTLAGEKAGVMIWSFCGFQLYQIPRISFSEFLWRPMPPEKCETQELHSFREVECEVFFTLSNDQCPEHHPEGWENWNKELSLLHRRAEAAEQARSTLKAPTS